MLKQAFLYTAVVIGSVIAALSSRAPADVGPQARFDIQFTGANLPETRMVDYTFVYSEGENDSSACSSAPTGFLC